VRLAIQLYTFRTLDESPDATIDRLADGPYGGVEFAGLDGSDPETVASALDDGRIAPVSAHVDANRIESDPGAVVDRYGRIGCDRIVVPSIGQDAFVTIDAARDAGSRLASLAERLGSADLHYHNHGFEFADPGSEAAFDAFAAAADDIGLEIDTGLANHAGADPVALLERYGDRVDLVHLTDSRPGDALHADLGTGTVDLDGCVAAAASAGVDWLVFEHGLTDDPVAAAADAADVIRGLPAFSGG
jgi:sugar phosphate isomerase/epimerase